MPEALNPAKLPSPNPMYVWIFETAAIEKGQTDAETLHGALKALQISVERVVSSNRQEFEEGLSRVTKTLVDPRAKAKGLVFAIHFSTHGSPTHIQVGSDKSDVLAWSELVERLRPMNDQTAARLFLSLSTCHALRFVESFGDNPPCFASFVPVSPRVRAFDMPVALLVYLYLLSVDQLERISDAPALAAGLEEGAFKFQIYDD